MRFVYNVLAIILVIFSIPVFFWRLWREPGFGRRMRQMFGFWPESELQNVAKKGCLWIHAASVGEVVAAAPIVREMHKAFPDRPLLISTVTATGNEMAHKIIKEASGIIFFPLDLPWLCTRILQRIDPDLFVLVETELWPNFLLATARRNLPVVMVNGRISDKSAQRYHYLRSLLREMIAAVTLFCMQSELDARYAVALGAPPEQVVVTGNTKFDQVYQEVDETEKQELLISLGFGEGTGPIFIAGSTHPGEESAVFTAFRELRRNSPTARLVLAPRDIRRSGEVLKLAAKFDISMIQRTQQISGLAASQAAPAVLLDTIGELGRLYSLGDIIFVGGSLIPRGGHNVLEPAAYGKPILVGPHMFNFKESYAFLSARGACRTVKDGNELAEVLTNLCRDSAAARSMGEAAAAVMQENRGAAQKSVEYMRRYV